MLSILMCIQTLVKFCPFIFKILVLKILSANKILTSIKGCNSVTNLRNLTLYNPNQILSMLMRIQNFVKFCPLFLKVLNGNEILTSIKGHNSVASLRRNLARLVACLLHMQGAQRSTLADGTCFVEFFPVFP